MNWSCCRVFDNLVYKVDGAKVTLFGEVTRPTLKSDAENVVKGIEGVESVDNQIEVLPCRPTTTASAWRHIERFTQRHRFNATS